MSDVSTVYRGTFIHLTRCNGSKPRLERNCGALWVSADGRISGLDWSITDDDSFRALMARQGWVDIKATNGQSNGESESHTVSIVIANEDQNEFFFPGFIGKSQSQSQPSSAAPDPSNKTRHTHPRPPVPKRRPLRLNNPARLARSIHLPRGIRLRQNKHHKFQLSPRCTPIRTTNLRPGSIPHPLPRHNLRLLLRNSPRASNECPSSSMPQARPTRIHRPRLHG